MSTDRKDLAVGCVTGGTVLTGVTLAMRMFTEIVFKVFGERGSISSDFSALKTVPDCYTLL